MSTHQEKIEAQRMALQSTDCAHLRHLIGPEELEMLLSGSRLRIEGENARTIIRNCHTLLRREYKKVQLWVLVRDITGHGMGYSIKVCESAGLDPRQCCGGTLTEVDCE